MTINKLEKTLVNIYPFWLERTIRTIKNQQLQKLKENNIDLTIEQWIVLLGVSNHEGSTQKEIAEQTIKDTANVKRIVDQIVKKGYVKKETDATDLRKTQLTLTTEGHQIISKALPLMDDIRQKGLIDVSEKEFDYLLSTLKKIYHNLT